MTREDFKDALSMAWMRTRVHGEGKRLISCLWDYAASFKAWSSSTFGSLPKKICETQAELAELNNGTFSARHIRRTKEKRIVLDRLLVLGEYYWRQRSRTEWLHGGDRSAKFFHLKASARPRRRKNAIEGHEDSQRN